MTILNPVSIIAGALSFSVALAWNRAVSDTLNNMTRSVSPVLQAVIITLIIIIVVSIINIGLRFYTNTTNDKIKDSVIKSAGDENAKVRLINHN